MRTPPPPPNCWKPHLEIESGSRIDGHQVGGVLHAPHCIRRHLQAVAVNQPHSYRLSGRSLSGHRGESQLQLWSSGSSGLRTACLKVPAKFVWLHTPSSALGQLSETWAVTQDLRAWLFSVWDDGGNTACKRLVRLSASDSSAC